MKLDNNNIKLIKKDNNYLVYNAQNIHPSKKLKLNFKTLKNCMTYTQKLLNKLQPFNKLCGVKLLHKN